MEAKDEIIVQRMRSEVTGKHQKHTRIGPWNLSLSNSTRI